MMQMFSAAVRTCFCVTSDPEGDDGGDRLRSRRDGDAGGMDQRRPHHYPFTGPAGNGYGK